MNPPRAFASVPLLFGLALLSAPAFADDELAKLRAENARLKAQLQAAQCQPAAAATPAASPAAPPTPAPATAVAAPVAAAAVTAPAVAVPAPAAAPAVPAGYKLVKIEQVDPETDAENCSHGGVFGKVKDAPWRHQEPWEDLEKRMNAAQVEGLLGKVHTAFVKDGFTEWEFGKCHSDSQSQAMVVFDRNGLLYWRSPDF